MMGKSRKCTAAVCRNGITLGSVANAFLPDAVAKIPFRKVEELAKAITLWNSDEKSEIKETLSRKDPYNIPVAAGKKGWRKAIAALTKSCPHRQQAMKESFGMPMYSGYRGIFAQRDPFFEATEKVRAEVNRSKGATKARLAIFGGARACTLSKVLVESERVAVKTAGKQLQFSNWSELRSSPWEMSPFTGIGIFLLDMDAKEKDVEEIVAALQKCPDVQAVIMAPPLAKGHEQVLQKMKEWFMAVKGKYADHSWIFAGWQDGLEETDLVFETEQQLFWRDGKYCSDNGNWTTMGARRFTAALKYCYQIKILFPRTQTQPYQKGSREFERCRGNEDEMQ
ncbi:unnamed protein product [Gongylonema pulchrum]|uniref:MTS domain-containing protein n=1 Tax=Gongylonema pulchrum TaxID=637853 RepID=A0A183ECY3_9BILA|nr:unnamed protein product [Gongylonema pulchrum]